MKEFLGSARNVFAAYDDESQTFSPMAEVVFLFAEPEYQVSLGGGVKSERTIGSTRIVFSERGLRRLSETALALADELSNVKLAEEAKENK